MNFEFSQIMLGLGSLECKLRFKDQKAFDFVLPLCYFGSSFCLDSHKFIQQTFTSFFDVSFLRYTTDYHYISVCIECQGLSGVVRVIFTLPMNVNLALFQSINC